MKTLSLFVKLLMVAGVLHCALADCPNACSGNGNCLANDSCMCHRNFRGADCSLRSCPHDYAFITTPEGDLNADGDRLDNSMKKISPTADATAQSDLVALSAAVAGGDVLGVGDSILIDNVDYYVLSVSAGNDQVILHKPFEGTTGTGKAIYRYLSTDYRVGASELWSGDHSVASSGDEGHYYMECANRGLCDRKTGTCKCFEGYAGDACQRTVCPNDCSGHGTCEYVNELRYLTPTLNTACTVEGTRGGLTLTTSADCTATGVVGKVADGDHVLVGDHSVALRVATAVGSAAASVITLLDPLPKDFPYGTALYLQPQYNLWDSNKNRACRCDPRYEGYDCSERKCPRGDDPLSVDQQWETQVVTVGGLNPENAVYGSFKLVFTDRYGEKWTTSSIPVAANADKSTEVVAALTALPNDVVRGVQVDNVALGTNTNGIRYHVKFNGGNTAPVTATGNAGPLPLMACDASQLKHKFLTAVDAYGVSPVPTMADSNLGGGATNANCDGSNVVTVTTAIATLTPVLQNGDSVRCGPGGEVRVLAGNIPSDVSGRSSFTVDRPFTAFTSGACDRVVAAVDITRKVTFDTSTNVPSTLISPGDVINIGGVGGEERVVESVTLDGLSDVTSLTVTEPWTTQYYGTVTAARYAVGGVDCTVTNVALMLEAAAAGSVVTAEVGPYVTSVGEATGVFTGVTVTAGSNVVTGTFVAAVSDGDTVQVGTELRLVKGNGGTVSSGTTFLVDRAFTVSATATTVDIVRTRANGDGTRLLKLSAAVSSFELAVGDKLLVKFGATPASNNAHEIVTVVSIASTIIQTVEPMDVHALGSTVYLYGKGTKEQSVCSGRGLCDAGTGTCKCFRGYTLDDCSRQNALAQ